MKSLLFRLSSYVAGPGIAMRILHAEYAWRKARAAHIAEEPMCQMCGTEKDLDVHHVFPWHLFEDLRFDRDNFVTLCTPCHIRFGHHWSYAKGYNPGILELCKAAQAQNARIAWKGRVHEPRALLAHAPPA